MNDFLRQVLTGFGDEWGAAGRQFEENRADAVDVGRGGELGSSACGLFRGHVLRRSHRGRRLR